MIRLDLISNLIQMDSSRCPPHSISGDYGAVYPTTPDGFESDKLVKIDYSSQATRRAEIVSARLKFSLFSRKLESIPQKISVNAARVLYLFVMPPPAGTRRSSRPLSLFFPFNFLFDTQGDPMDEIWKVGEKKKRRESQNGLNLLSQLGFSVLQSVLGVVPYYDCLDRFLVN